MFFLKKKPKPGQTDRFRFFREKTGMVRFSSFGSVFSVLARFFPVWLCFGLVFPVWLDFFRFRFGFFWFFAYKTETEPNRLVFSKF